MAVYQHCGPVSLHSSQPGQTKTSNFLVMMTTTACQAFRPCGELHLDFLYLGALQETTEKTEELRE